MPGGRPADVVWTYFGKVEEGGHMRAVCHGCELKFSPVVRRLWAHARVCLLLVERGYDVNGAPAPMEDDDMPSSASSMVRSASSQSSGSSNSSLGNVSTDEGPRKRPKQTCLHPVVTDQKTKDALDMLLTRFIVGANLPFRAVEHQEFKKFMSVCRPGYKTPNRHDVAGELLNALYRAELEKTIINVWLFPQSLSS
jgi:hypothetical protein